MVRFIILRIGIKRTKILVFFDSIEKLNKINTYPSIYNIPLMGI